MTTHPTVSSIGSHREIPIMRLLVCLGATFSSKGCVIGFGTPCTLNVDRGSFISFCVDFSLQEHNNSNL